MIPNMMTFPNGWQTGNQQTVQMTRTVVQETIRIPNQAAAEPAIYQNHQGFQQQNILQVPGSPNQQQQHQVFVQVATMGPQNQFQSEGQAVRQPQQLYQMQAQGYAFNFPQQSVNHVNGAPPPYSNGLNGMQQSVNSIRNNSYQAIPNQNGYVTVKKPRMKTTPVGSGPKISVRNVQSLNKVNIEQITGQVKGNVNTGQASLNNLEVDVPQITGNEDFETIFNEALEIELNRAQMQARQPEVNVNRSGNNGQNGVSFIIPNVQDSVINRSNIPGHVTSGLQKSSSTMQATQIPAPGFQGRMIQQPRNSPTYLGNPRSSPTVQATVTPPPVQQGRPQNIQPPRISPSDINRVYPGNQNIRTYPPSQGQIQVPVPNTPQMSLGSNQQLPQAQIVFPPNQSQPNRTTPMTPSPTNPVVNQIQPAVIPSNQFQPPSIPSSQSQPPGASPITLESLLSAPPRTSPPIQRELAQRNTLHPAFILANLNHPRPPTAAHHRLPKTVQGPLIPPPRRPSFEALSQSRRLLEATIMGNRAGQTPSNVSNTASTSSQPKTSNLAGLALGNNGISADQADSNDSRITINSILNDYFGKETSASEVSTEKSVPEKSAASQVPEKSGEKIVPEKSAEKIVPEKSAENIVPEKSAEKIVPEKSAEKIVAENSAERVVPEKPAEMIPEKRVEKKGEQPVEGGPDQQKDCENEVSIVNFIIKEISSKSRNQNKFTCKKEKPWEPSPEKTTRERSPSVFSPPPQPESQKETGNSPPFSIEDSITCNGLEKDSVQITLFEPGTSKKKPAEMAEKIPIKKPVKKMGPKSRTYPEYKKLKDEYKKSKEIRNKEKKSAKVTKKVELAPKRYVTIAPKPDTARNPEVIKNPAASRKPEAEAPKKPAVAPKPVKIASKPETTPKRNPAEFTWVDRLKNSEKHLVSADEPTPGTSSGNSEASTPVEDAPKITFKLTEGKGPYSMENFNAGRKTNVEESKKSGKSNKEKNSPSVAEIAKIPKVMDLKIPKPAGFENVSAATPTTEIVKPKQRTEAGKPKEATEAGKSKNTTEATPKTPTENKEIPTNSEPALPETEKAPSEASSWTSSSSSSSEESSSAKSNPRSSPKESPVSISKASKRKFEVPTTSAEAPPSKKSKPELPTSGKSAEVSKMAESTNKCAPDLSKLEALKKYVEEDDKTPKRRSSEEESSSSHRRKISKAAIVKNKNNQREKISIVSKDRAQKLAEKKDLRKSPVEPERERSSSSSRISNDSNNNNKSEDVKPDLNSINLEQQKTSREGKYEWIDAFQRSDTHYCVTCGKQVSSDLFWMNLKKQELKCTYCLPKEIDADFCINKTHEDQIEQLQTNLHAALKQVKKLKKKLKSSEKEVSKCRSPAIEKIRRNLVKDRKILMQDSSDEESN